MHVVSFVASQLHAAFLLFPSAWHHLDGRHGVLNVRPDINAAPPDDWKLR